MNTVELSKRLITYFPNEPTERRLLFNLLNWLAEGSPLSRDQISHRTGYSVKELDGLLKKMPGIELAGSGDLVSVAGLSLQETDYPMNGERSRIYAQSALDAVVVPTLLLKKISIEYLCPGDPILVYLRFCFDQAFTIQPDDAVISFPSRTDPSAHLRDDRPEFRLFPNPDSARRWLWKNPEGVILSVKNVFAAAVTLRRALTDSDTPLLASRR